MKLRFRMITAALLAGYLFIPLLGALLYWGLPENLRTDLVFHIRSAPDTLGIAFMSISGFWVLAGAIGAYFIQRRIDRSLVAVRRRVQEAFITRRQAEKQREFIAQFATAVRPVASRIVGYASEVATHAQQLATQMHKTSEALAGTREVHDLLASSDELSSEIGRSNEETRASNAHLEAAVFTLGTLRQHVPSFKEQLTTLHTMARQLSILAINASIETSRPGLAPGLAIVAGEIKHLAQQATEAVNNVQQRLSGIEDLSNRGLATLEPLMQNLRQLSMAFATIGSMADGQWKAAERLASKTDKACALTTPEELADTNHKLLDIVQVLADQTALLQHSVETLDQRLRTAA